ncbi:MAG TPA: tetratricopeptide repeat protein [Candidatus Binatia bacterium]
MAVAPPARRQPAREPFAAPPVTEPARPWERWLPIALVVLATAVAYVPTLRNGFVDFDDQTNLTENPFFRSFDATSLRWMLTNIDGHYLPLTWLSYAVDFQIWGMNPVGYHLTNLLLHLANAIAFALLGVRLLCVAVRIPRERAPRALWIAAAIAAGLFALHPLRVESVAWATERRDVLSGLFFLLALEAYVRFHAARRDGIAWSALAWYLPSLLAKPVGMGLPLALVALDFYPLGRLRGAPRTRGPAAQRERRAVWIEKIPFVLLGLGAAVLEGIAERSAATFYTLAQHGIPGRIGQAFYALAFYLAKTVVPVGLSPLYQLPVGWQFMRGDVFASIGFVVAVAAVLFALRRRVPALLTAAAVYVAMLAPVLGFAQAGPHITADRYSYLATLGWAVVVAGAIFELDLAARAGRRPPLSFGTATGVASAVMVVLAVLTWRQIGVWHDSETLWRTAVAADDQCYVCLNNLGNALIRAGRNAEAPPYFEAAMRVQPDSSDAHVNLGVVAMQQGRDAEARREFERALAMEPTHAVANTNLAKLIMDDDVQAAIAHLRTALQREPDMAEAHTSLGLGLMNTGDMAGAERELRRAVVLQPDFAIARNNLGVYFFKQSQPDEAAREFQRAAELDPSFAEPRYNLALVLASQDRSEEAIVALREAVRIRPAYPGAQQKLIELLVVTGRDDEARAQSAVATQAIPDGNAPAALALAYMQAGKAREAIAELRALLAKDPDNADNTSTLAWMLATTGDASLRDGKTAVALAERAVAAAGDAVDADRLDTLAAAYAEVGRFDEAVATAQRARSIAETAGSADLAHEIAERLALYERRQPYRVD